MARQRLLGKVEPVKKVWFSKKELSAYLGVSERFIAENLNKRSDVEIFKLTGKIFLYNKDNIDRVIKKASI